MKKPPVSLPGSAQALATHQELAAAVIRQAVLDASHPDTPEGVSARARAFLLASSPMLWQFMERRTVAARQTQPGGRSDIAVLFVDLNKFKAINDQFGHVFGNRLLVAIAQRLRQCVRPDDGVGRIGGGEFAVLLENVTNEADVLALVRRIEEALDKPFSIDEREVRASASLGVAVGWQSDPEPQCSPELDHFCSREMIEAASVI